MYFSDRFEVDAKTVEDYGAVDISLVCDVPLFIDPMLIFNSNNSEYQKLHQEMIRFFSFLYAKSKEGLSPKEISAWFNFSEVPNNWLGYSLVGNKGVALGENYATFLYENIAFAIENNSVSKGKHIEKAMLLYDGSGKDKISDLTVNLIKRFLCEYTQEFANRYIDSDFCETFFVDRAYFNYDTESFVSEEYHLPYVFNIHGRKEYVLLTPSNILREDEPSINRRDFFDSHEKIRASIENDDLRAYVNNYIAKAVANYMTQQKRNRKKPSEKTIHKIEKDAFKEVVARYPILYDYYVALQENNTMAIRQKSFEEFSEQHTLFIDSAKRLIALYDEEQSDYMQPLTAREEAKRRIKYFKHIIEDCDGYKNLYVNGKRISKESDLQRLFQFVWYGTGYKLDAEANNGRGQADFIVSKGSKNQNIVEFKLASNSRLSHVFEQVKIYEVANQSENSLIVIFYFSEAEHQKTMAMIQAACLEDEIGKSIYIVDCREDNKKSASIA